MTSPERRRRPVSPVLRHTFVAVLALWVLMPLLLSGRVAQDAVPYLATGHIAHSHPDEVYAARNGDLFDLRPGFRHAWCDAAPRVTDCNDLAVAFVSTPPVIPVTFVLAKFGDRIGQLGMQFAAALMLAGGMWLLWRRLAHRSRRAPVLMVLTAFALTPMAMVPIGLGQTSPILFLSVCLGLTTSSARRRLGISATWTAATLLKVFPIALVGLLVWRRRTSVIVWSIAMSAVLALATFAIVPVSVWGDFVRVTKQLSAHMTTNPYNGSVASLVVRLSGGSSTGAALIAGRLVAVAAAGAVCWFAMRRTNDDTRWAAGYVALLLVTPLVWWHYVWVLVGAIAVALGARERLDDRMMAILPAVALVTIVPSIPNANGSSWPIPQALILLGFSVVFCVLATTVRVSPESIRTPDEG